MAVALPELPDDRRARPQRIPPGTQGVRTPPGGQRESRPEDVAAVNGSRPVPNGARGANGTGAQVPIGRPFRPPVLSTPPRRPNGAAGPPPRRSPAPPPADDDPTDVHGPLVDADDDEVTEVHGRLVDDRLDDDRLDDDRLVDEDEPDEPQDDGPAPEVPGRHRRRAGESPEERPAADYKAQADAARTGRKPRSGRRRRENFWRELPVLVVVALVLTFLIQTFLAKVYVIPSGSMETTLHGCTGCTNDRVLVDKVTYRFRDPQPGDVVVFRGPDSWTNTEFSVPETDNALVNGLQQFGSLIGLAPPDEKDFVKRVIAVGGQTVQCCDSRDRVLVDGEPLDEPYIYYIPESRQRQDPFDPVVVPEGQLWLMGDSRNNSADSRAVGHGPVPVENVIGQARVIVLPFARFGWVSAIDPHPADAGALPVGAAGDGAGVPLALGMVGTLPLALWRRRRGDASERFLP